MTDSYGDYNQSAPVMITITPPLEITSFSAITPISLDQSTLFTNTTIGGTGSNVWSYSIYSGPVGGSLIGIGNNKFKFTVAGTYVVQLNVIDFSGEKNSSQTTVVVNPELTLAPLPSPINLDQGQSYSYTAVASAGTSPYTYTWTVNGLTESSGCGPTSTTCNVIGNTVHSGYTVSVKVTDVSAGTPPENVTSTSVVNVTRRCQ